VCVCVCVGMRGSVQFMSIEFTLICSVIHMCLEMTGSTESKGMTGSMQFVTYIIKFAPIYSVIHMCLGMTGSAQ